MYDLEKKLTIAYWVGRIIVLIAVWIPVFTDNYEALFHITAVIICTVSAIVGKILNDKYEYNSLWLGWALISVLELFNLIV